MLRPTDERVLGFDVRVPKDTYLHLWDAARRERFLLRTDAAVPLSVDDTVWPSVFDSGQGIGFSQDERERLGFAGVPLPAWIGPNAGLWDNMSEMTDYLSQRASISNVHIVAVTLLSDRGLAEAGRAGPYLGTASPPEPEAAWRRLGFDVADGSRVGALSNCGYGEDEASGLAARWAGLLNEHHLFDDVAAASRFRDLSDERVREHAPFFVYGLYEVERAG